MSKHQEALNELKEFIHSELDGTRMLDKYLGYIEDLKELVNQTKTPTLEEVKKEWEALGYIWVYFNSSVVRLINDTNDTIIVINSLTKCYNTRLYNDIETQHLTIEEHNLLTKTFRALGWEV